jgi:hypothetical protein
MPLSLPSFRTNLFLRMMMRSSVLLALVFCSFISRAQVTITIGAGANVGTTSSNAGPIHRSSAASTLDFSNRVYLYTAAELSAAGINLGDQITTIAWNKSNAFGTAATNNVSVWKVYMKNSVVTPGATWSSTNFATQTTGATLVYNNTAQIIPLTAGYIPLTLSAPFTYTGGSLEIGSDWDCSLFAGSPTTGGFAWRTDALTNQVFGGSSSTSTVTMALQTVRPQIQITTIPTAPCAGQPIAGNTTGPSSVCPSAPFVLGLESAAITNGITYQWESANDSGFTINVTPMGTSITQSTSQTTAKYYRCLVTCTNSSLSAYSATLYVPMSAFLFCYCTSTPTVAFDEEIYNVTLNGSSTNLLYANAAGCTTVAPGPGSLLGRYSNFKTLPALTQMEQGTTVPFFVEENECDGAPYWACGTGIWIDYNHDGDYTDAGEEVFKETSTLVGPRTISGTIAIPMAAPTGNTTMRIIVAEGYSGAGLTPCLSYSHGETEDYLIEILPTSACQGMPAPGNTTASAASACLNVVVSLGVSNTALGTGITYQWEQADDAAFTVNLVNLGTGPTESVTVTAPHYYRCKVTCSNSGLYTYSVETNVAVNDFLSCYCTSIPVYPFDEEIYNVTVNGGSTNPLYANAAACTTVAPGPGSILGRYSNFKTLAPIATLNQAVSASFTIVENECEGAPFYQFGTGIWIDYNHDGDYTDPGEEVFKETTTSIGPRNISGSFLVPANASIGITTMRIMVAENASGPSLTPCLQYNLGETEDYLVDIQASNPCSGAPSPGNTVASISAYCAPGVVNLSLSTPSSTSDITYQWQQADDAMFSINVIALGTNLSQTVTLTGGNKYFRCIVTCTTSGLSANSVPAYVTQNASTLCYCPVTNVGTQCISNITMGTLNNTTAGCPGGTNYTQQPGTTNLVQGTSENFTITEDGGSIISVWIDFDQSGTFDASEHTQVALVSTSPTTVAIPIPLSATLGVTGMRVRTRLQGSQNGPNDACIAMASGETEDYLVTIVANPACSGTPTPGNTLANASSVCTGNMVHLSLQNVTMGAGVSYQWESADDAGFTINVQTLGTAATQTATVTVPTYYRCQVLCTNSASSSYSSEVFVGINTDPCVCAAYCIPTTTLACDEYISNVSFAGINNNSGCSYPYENFTSVASGAVTAGQTYTLTYNCPVFYPGTSSDKVTAYFDWNHDGDFADASETYTTNNLASGTGIVAVPCDALAGSTRMRVRIMYISTTPSDPCAQGDWSEAEDYCVHVTPVGCAATLNLKCFIQGYYIGTGIMHTTLSNQGLPNPTTDCDDITVELHHASFPYSVAYSITGILQTNGTIACPFPTTAIGNSYYIAVRHRNSIETWSANPVTISAITNYDFTTFASQAYGGNQIEVEPVVWAMYSGDINQDGAIDGFDYTLLDPDIIAGASGYLTTDLSGDGIVDAYDYILLDPNIISGITIIMP